MIRLSLMAILLSCAVDAQAQKPMETPTAATSPSRKPAPIHWRASATAPGAKPSAYVRVSSGVMATLLLEHTQPTYPTDAKDPHLVGTVILQAKIGKKGLVEELTALSGPAPLEQAAVDAVQQWTYKPYLLNDKPVGVDTLVLVDFGAAPALESSLVLGPGDVPAGKTPTVIPGKPIKRVKPIYPPEAQQQHISGTVMVHATITKTGRVINASAQSGPELLRKAAIQAFQQWRFSPSTLSGQPVEVQVNQGIDFKLNAPTPDKGR